MQNGQENLLRPVPARLAWRPAAAFGSCMHLNGRILAVQEGRFRLLTDAGQVYLLTLAQTARLDSRSLEQYLAARTRLTVDFTGEPNFVGGVANAVRAQGSE